MRLQTTAAVGIVLALLAPAAAHAAPGPAITTYPPVHSTVATSSTGTSSSSGSYTLWPSPDGGPIRWNPCTPVFYRVNLKAAPSGALADVQSAVAQVSAATGIRFVYEGTTPVIPQAGYGFNKIPAPPLVIAWARPGTAGQGNGQSSLLPATASASAVGGWVDWHGHDAGGDHKWRIVTGYVVVNVGAIAHPGFVPGPNSRGAILLHELGHAVGLNHTSDPTQVMYPTAHGAVAYGAGDLAGLRLVGAGAGCLS